MCGRFNLRTNPAEFAAAFGAEPPADARSLLMRYNIAPTQPILAVRAAGDRREAVVLKWGLVPSWADDPRIGSCMINARSESVGDKPSFRAAFKRRRCLIPASGFYEWRQSAPPKQPYHIFPHAGGLMAFAGLWEHWSASGAEPLETATILTTDANRTMATLHDRMPVILLPSAYELWLDEATPRERLQALLRPAPEDLLDVQPISTLVNNVRNTGPECLTPAEG